MSQPLVSSSNISVQFENEQVLNHLSFEIPRHRHTIFKGESGSGKSTLIKLLLGFLKPSAGKIRYADNDRNFLRRQTAWLPQDLNLGEGTVEEVIKKPFEFKSNSSRSPDTDTIVQVVTTLGLTKEDLRKQFRDLSTGQRQRVGIALCYLLDKPVLMLDEPTSALDSTSKQKVVELLLQNGRKTVISTSHDPFWLDYADNIIELN